MALRSIRIHHLSDLHFGKFEKPPAHAAEPMSTDWAKLGLRTFADQYVTYLETCSDDHLPDFVVVSGDLTSIGDDDEFDLASGFLKKVADAWAGRGAGVDRKKRIIVVPGNHDFSYVKLDTDPTDKTFFDMQVRFAARFHDYVTCYDHLREPQKDGKLYSSSRCSLTTANGLPVAFVCVDSDYLAGHLNKEHIKALADLERDFVKSVNKQKAKQPDLKEALDALHNCARYDPGFVQTAEFDDAIRSLKSDNEDRWKNALKICVLHHPVFPVNIVDLEPKSVLLNAGNFLQRLKDAGMHLVLAGHVHKCDATYVAKLCPEGQESGLHCVTSGTLGSIGDDQKGFLDITIDVDDGHHTEGWLCNVAKVASEGGQMTRAPTPTRCFFIEQDRGIIHKVQSTQIGLFAREKSKASAARDMLAKVTRLLRGRRTDPTLKADVVNDFDQDVRSARRIYAVDVQAFDAWIDPLVFYYFCLQLPRYVAAALDVDRLEWTIRPTRLLRCAIDRALENPTHTVVGGSITLFGGKDKSTTVAEAVNGDTVELVRILLWDRETLISEDGRNFCKMHDALRIPLFYLDPNSLGNEGNYLTKEELKGVPFHPGGPGNAADLFENPEHYEYIYCLGDSGVHIGGLWVDLSVKDAPPKDAKIADDGPTAIAGKFNHQDHFEKLLCHKKLLFASDVINLLRRCDDAFDRFLNESEP